jgi:hypothetical protein
MAAAIIDFFMAVLLRVVVMMCFVIFFVCTSTDIEKRTSGDVGPMSIDIVRQSIVVAYFLFGESDGCPGSERLNI